jgi:hypothetical protein
MKDTIEILDLTVKFLWFSFGLYFGDLSVDSVDGRGLGSRPSKQFTSSLYFQIRQGLSIFRITARHKAFVSVRDLCITKNAEPLDQLRPSVPSFERLEDRTGAEKSH